MTTSLELQEQPGNMPFTKACCWLRALKIVMHANLHGLSTHFSPSRIPLSVTRLGHHPFECSTSITNAFIDLTNLHNVNLMLLWSFIVNRGKSPTLTSDGASNINRHNH